MTTTASNTATAKQIAFYTGLHNQYVPLMQNTKMYIDATDDVKVQLDEFLAGMLSTFPNLSVADASYTIDATIKNIKKLQADQNIATTAVEKTTNIETLKAGAYLVGDKVFKVYRGRSGYMLAKQGVVINDEGGFVFGYVGAAHRFVKAENLMTLDQAQDFGRHFGVCCVCGRTLTNGASIDAGIGPICSSKF